MSSATYSSMCKKIQFQFLGLSSSSSSSPLAEEEQESMLLHKKQGIVTVLASDFNRDRASAATSLRRTLSADMSSKKWLSHDSFSSSSEGEDDQEEEEERFQIWSTIKRDEKMDQKHDDDEENNSPPTPPTKLNTWSSILFDKAKEETSNNSVTPYIHPLMKRSKSSLSEKSLEICTESLGSETGSDNMFSSDNSNSSRKSETEDDKEEEQQQHEEEAEHLQVPKQNLHHVVMRKSMTRCFPPPLPSIHMRSHRDGYGRLFLDAVTVASQNNNFSAQRQDGRLVLTFASDEEEEEEEEKDEVDGEFEEEFVGFEEDDDDVEEGKEYEEDENYDENEVVEVEAVMEEEPLLSSGVITSNVHRLALMMNKSIGVANRNTKNWSEKFNKVVNFEGSVVEKQLGLVAQSLPPRPRVVARLIPSAPPMAPVSAASSGSLNSYDCYWGTKHTSEVEHNKYSSSVVMKNNDRGRKVIFYGDVNYWNSGDGDKQNLVVMRGKNGDYLIHKSKSCKDSRRSFLFWEPRCIAA